VTSDRCAIGFRVHSGWAIAAIVAGTVGETTVLARRRVALAPSDAEEFVQPYHAASGLKLEDARKVIARAERSAARFAMDGLRDLLSAASLEISGCAILTSKAKIPDDLESVLGSHALIHAAEGNLFREAIAQAATAYAFGVQRFLEHEVATHLPRMTVNPGPPWTKDEKLASLAGLLALEQRAPALA